MVEINCRKEKSKLIFTRQYDGRVAVYDLADNTCYNYQGRRVKTLNSYFVNCTISDVTFEDEAYERFVSSIKRGNSRLRNVGSLLQLLYRYKNNEQWALMGMTFSRPRTDKPSDYPKIVFRYLRECDIRVSDNHSFLRMYSDPKYQVLLQNAVELYREDPNSISYITFFRDRYSTRRIVEMIEQHNCNIRSLLLRIEYYIRAEGIEFYNTISELQDYMNMSKKMSAKYDKYPKYLLSSHNIVAKNYRAFRERYDEECFGRMVDKSLAHKGVTYSVLVPETGKDVQQEGANQHHCVASYVKTIIAGRCQIVFMRKNTKLDDSLLTIEVRDGNISQARGSYNRPPSEDEKKFLVSYAKTKKLTLGKYI